MKRMRPTHQLVKRMVPALAVWAVGRVLEMPRVKKRLGKIDERVFETRHHVVKNASRNRAWFAAGATACAVGLGLMAKAAKK